MNNESDRNYSFLLKLIYIVLVMVSCFRFSIYPIKSGLDPSWEYALNVSFHEGTLWGRDVIFTYGPLGVILYPHSYGIQHILSLAFWCVVSLTSGAVFSYILFSRKFESLNLSPVKIFLSFSLFYIGSWVFSVVSGEYLLPFMVVCLLSVCRYTDEFKFFLMASILTVLAVFMKFNQGTTCFLTLILYVMSGYACGKFNNGKLKHYIGVICAVPVVFCLCFLIYNPSLNELIYYLRGAYEISSGYNSAMSNVDISERVKILFAVLMFCEALTLIIILTGFSFFRAKHSFGYAVIFSAVIFMAFKHSFVREDHFNFFLPSIFMYSSVYVLFMGGELKANRKFIKFIAASMSLFFIVSFGMPFVNSDKVELLNNETVSKIVRRFFMSNPLHLLAGNIKTLNKAGTVYDEREDFLPDEFIQTISEDSAAVYPFEISYIQDIKNHKIMPVLQSYSVYTAWLDGENAEFFADPERAPKFIVFSLDAIDDRYPLIECPQTWFEIFRNYGIRLRDNDKFLLERIPEKKFTAGNTRTITFSRDDEIQVPASDNYSLMKIRMPLTLWGKAVKILYKIPRVNMQVELYDGRKITKRVLLENMTSDVLLDVLPGDEEAFTAVISGSTNINRVKSIRFSGDGLKYYNSTVEVSFSELIRKGS